MKHWRNPLLMLLVLVGLGAYVKLKENKPVREHPLVVEFEPKDVTQVELKGPKASESIVLTKKGDDWRMSQPLDTAADATAVEAVLTATKEVMAISQFGATELKKYGLDKPKTTLKVKLKGGKSEQLVFGGKAPGDTSTYAMKSGTKTVYLVPTTVAEAADKSTDDLRDKTALRFDLDAVTGVTLTHSAKTFELVKESEANWQMKQPLKAAGDAVALDGLLNTVKGLKATRFIAEKPDDLKQYGLDAPQVKLELALRKKSSVTLLIGAKSKEDPTAVYARASNEPPVYLLTNSVLNQLKKETNELRGKNVLALETTKVTRLVATSANGDLDLERSGASTAPSWKVLKPRELPADKIKVDAILNTINNLKASEFIDAPKSEAEYGFDKPQGKITVWLEGGKSPYRTLLVGKQVKSPDGLFVKVAGEPTIFKTTASGMDVENLMPKLIAVREKVISHFEHDQVEKVTLTPAEGKPIVLVRSGKDDWKITSPEKADGNKIKLDTVLFAAADLRGDEWIEDDPKDLAKYGLDKPRLEVEVKVKGSASQRFKIGKKDGEKAFVMTQGKSVAVYTKSEFSLADLFQDFAALRKQ